MRTRLALLLISAGPLQAGAEPKGYCSGGDVAEVAGTIDEVVVTDPASPEIIFDRSMGKCRVDAIRLQSAAPSTCAEGRRATGEGLVHVSPDGTWTWIEAHDVRCE